MSVNFETFISRIDEEVIQQIVGRSALRILNTIDPDLSQIAKLQKALLKIYSPVELLANKQIRDGLLDLLKVEEANSLLTLFGKTGLADPYPVVKSIRYKNESEFGQLLSFFEIVRPTAPEIVVVENDKHTEAKYPLFAHQRNAVVELNPKLYENGKRALLHMPTGSGKTRTAMNVICSHLRLKEPTIIIWLAHTEELCEQAAQEFERAWGFLGNRNLRTIRYWGDADIDLSEVKDGFIIAGLIKMFNLLKSDSSSISKLAAHTSLVIMDEAHMAIAPAYKSTLQILLSFRSSLLGLSATPGRTWNNPQADLELSSFFNRQKVTLTIPGYSNPVDYLVEKGYLAKVINSPLLYESGIKLSTRDEEYLKSHFELPDSYLKVLSEDQKRNILIIQKVEKLIAKHQRIILFALSVEHSNLLATCLQARGVNAFSVTSNTGPEKRKDLIDTFKATGSEPIVLCNYGILTTGFDAPKTSCAVICRPTDSLVLYSQMVGRAIRGTNAGGNSEAEIVTVIDTVLPGFDKVQSAFFNWEDVW